MKKSETNVVWVRASDDENANENVCVVNENDHVVTKNVGKAVGNAGEAA